MVKLSHKMWNNIQYRDINETGNLYTMTENKSGIEHDEWKNFITEKVH